VAFVVEQCPECGSREALSRNVVGLARECRTSSEVGITNDIPDSSEVIAELCGERARRTHQPRAAAS
jgi:hypothetical protein